MVRIKQRILSTLLTSTACLTAVGLVLAMPATAQARVTRIAIENNVSPAFDGASFGNAGQYETLAGKAFGELDPTDPHNAVIQDIKLAPRNARGMVEYTATFQIVKPVDMSKASRLMWHDVPNRAAASPSCRSSAPTATSAFQAAGRATVRVRQRRGRTTTMLWCRLQKIRMARRSPAA